MKLTELCERLQHSFRWKLLPAALALTMLLGFLPAFIRLLAAALLLLLALTFYVYRTHLPAGMDAMFARMPEPADAKAAVVLIDAGLLDEGTRMRCAAQPISCMSELSLKMGSGALLLGAAMALMAQEMSPTDAAAVKSAVHALNFRTSLLRRRSPVLHRSRDEHSGIVSLTVQDGQQQRVYYMGEPLKLAAMCGSIHEDRVRYISHNDRERIGDTEKYMQTGGCRVIAYATAASGEKPTFLGMIGLGDGLREEAVADAARLRRMGYVLMLRDDEEAPYDMNALQEALDLQEVTARPDLFLCLGEKTDKRILPDPGNSRCLTILPSKGSLCEPIEFLQRYFASLEQVLQTAAIRCGLALLCALMGGSGFALAGTALLLSAGIICYGRPDRTSRSTLLRYGLIAILALIAHLFLSASPAAGYAGGFMAFLIAAAVVLGFPEKLPDRSAMRPLLILLGVLALMLMLLCLGGMPAVLLPMLFSLLCGALGSVILLLPGKENSRI